MVVVCAALLAATCSKVPLLAPQQSTITVSSNTSTVQANGTAEIRATVLESSGTPVHNGTTVTFTTNLGALTPTEARTVNGVATVQFIANGQSGKAQVKALSGGAASEAIELSVGTAAAARVIATANPNQIQSGNTSIITALVTDTGGTPLTGVPVSFSTDSGSLSSSAATTGPSGEASVTLSATRDATVTATAGGATAATVKVTVGTQPEIAISTTTANPTEGTPVTFNVAVTAGTATEPFQSMVVDFGDGTTSGPLSGTTQNVSHTYESSGTFTVAATGATLGGATKRGTMSISVAPAAAVSFTMAASPNPVAVGSPTLLSVTFEGTAPTNISRYDWTFGDGTTATTTGRSVNHVYESTGTKQARVTVRTTNGNSGSGSMSVVVTRTTLNFTLSANPNPTNVGTLTTFSVSYEGATPSNIAGYDWTFGDGTPVTTTTGRSVTHVYTTPGTKPASVTVRTTDGESGTSTTQVIVN